MARLRMVMCLSCKKDCRWHFGTCRLCYEEAGEREKKLKSEFEDLKSKVNFLRLQTLEASPTPSFADVVLLASDSADPDSTVPPIPAHRAVLISRSPVFKAMLENKTEESLSGTIKISEASYDALRAFVSYLYTADANLDEHIACDLFVLAQKYRVDHLKTYCVEYLLSKLSWENSLAYYSFAIQHRAWSLYYAAMELIVENMDKVTKQKEYRELVEKEPRWVIDIYEDYLYNQVKRLGKLGR